MLEAKSISRNLHGSKPRSCKHCPFGSQLGHWSHYPKNFWGPLIIGSLQLLPVLMTSQTSILLHGLRCLETVSTNSSGDEDDTQVDPEDFMTSEAITTRQNRVSKAMNTTMPPTRTPVSPPPSSPSTPSVPPSPVPFSPCLPTLLPLLCIPHQLVYHLQFSTRGRNHTWLSASNRGSPQALKRPKHPSHPNRGLIFTNSAKIPLEMQAMIHVEHGPLQEVICLYCSIGFD